MERQDPLTIDHDELVRRIENDLMDGYDEELELEIEDCDSGSSADQGESAA